MKIAVDATQKYLGAGFKAQDIIREVVSDVVDDYQIKNINLTIVVGDYEFTMDGSTVYMRSCEVLNQSYYDLYNRIYALVSSK